MSAKISTTKKISLQHGSAAPNVPKANSPMMGGQGIKQIATGSAKAGAQRNGASGGNKVNMTSDYGTASGIDPNGAKGAPSSGPTRGIRG